MEGKEGRIDEGQGILIFHGDVVQITVVDAGMERAILLANDLNPAPTGEEDGRMIPAARDSPMYSSIDSHSGR